MTTYIKTIGAMALPALAAALLAACSTMADGEAKARGIAQFADDVRLGEEVSKVCFNRSIDGFGETTDDTVVLKRGVSEEYIVEVFGVCQDLDFAQRIALDSHSSCLRRNDYLVVSDSIAGSDPNGLDRCSIRKIHKWDSDAEAEAEESETTEGAETDA